MAVVTLVTNFGALGAAAQRAGQASYDTEWRMIWFGLSSSHEWTRRCWRFERRVEHNDAGLVDTARYG